MKILFQHDETSASIVNDMYIEDIKKEQVWENSENSVGFSKEVVVNFSHRGRDVFRYAFVVCKHNINRTNYDNPKYVDGLSGVIENKGLSHYEDYYTKSYFDHYFRHIYM